MVKDARHPQSLFLSTTQYIAPFADAIEPPLASSHVLKSHHTEDGLQELIRQAPRKHIFVSVRVDNLVAERAYGHVGALWNVEHVTFLWFAQATAVNGPQAADDAEERGFAAAATSEEHHT